MARVHIPAAMRPTAGGAVQVEVPGATLGEVVDNLEAQFPGLKARLTDGNRIRSALAVFIDGTQASSDLRTRVNPQSEIYFAPAMAGGSSVDSSARTHPPANDDLRTIEQAGNRTGEALARNS